MSLVLNRRKYRGHPELCVLGFDLRDLLERVKAVHPTLASKHVEVWIHTQPTLACVEQSDSTAAIHLHSLLNRDQTPERVIRFILCHELLHFVVPPREVEGKLRAHPPEFWNAEQTLVPDRTIAWVWLSLVLGTCLKGDKLQECTFVKPCWRQLLSVSWPTLEQVADMVHSGHAQATDKDGLL